MTVVYELPLETFSWTELMVEGKDGLGTLEDLFLTGENRDLVMEVGEVVARIAEEERARVTLLLTVLAMAFTQPMG